MLCSHYCLWTNERKEWKNTDGWTGQSAVTDYSWADSEETKDSRKKSLHSLVNWAFIVLIEDHVLAGFILSSNVTDQSS